jgi:hypothetical protein
MRDPHRLAALIPPLEDERMPFASHLLWAFAPKRSGNTPRTAVDRFVSLDHPSHRTGSMANLCFDLWTVE